MYPTLRSICLTVIATAASKTKPRTSHIARRAEFHELRSSFAAKNYRLKEGVPEDVSAKPRTKKIKVEAIFRRFLKRLRPLQTI